MWASFSLHAVDIRWNMHDDVGLCDVTSTCHAALGAWIFCSGLDVHACMAAGD